MQLEGTVSMTDRASSTVPGGAMDKPSIVLSRREIIPVAFEARWYEPVLIMQKWDREMICGPADAIRHIKTRFPDYNSPLFCRALDICFASLKREADVDVSRLFFLAAYEDHLKAGRASR